MNALIKALEEQCKISLSGASSSLGPLHHQAVDVSSLATCPVLKNHLALYPLGVVFSLIGVFSITRTRLIGRKNKSRGLVLMSSRGEGHLGSHLRAALEWTSMPWPRGLPLLLHANKWPNMPQGPVRAILTLDRNLTHSRSKSCSSSRGRSSSSRCRRGVSFKGPQQPQH